MAWGVAVLGCVAVCEFAGVSLPGKYLWHDGAGSYWRLGADGMIEPVHQNGETDRPRLVVGWDPEKNQHHATSFRFESEKKLHDIKSLRLSGLLLLLQA